MGTIQIVEGAGGSARAVARAVAAVTAEARRTGWSTHVVALDALAGSDTGDRIVLCGGDGLVHRAVQHLTGAAVDVAIVPVGSGNDFVRAFGITEANAAAIAGAAPDATATRQVDLIAGDDGRRAASVVTFGYAGRVNATANSMSFPPGSAKYTVAAVREVGRLAPRFAKLTIELPEGQVEVIEEPLTLVAVGNTAWFGGGMQICAGADPADGVLQVTVVGPLSRRAFLRWLPKSFDGSHGEHPAVSMIAATAVTIETRESLWADGESFGAAPVSLRALPGALRLCVPAPDG